ncbi:hypothetical protein V5N11_011985 [Cardamine amara subsp. amara]|uniref:CCHC-type domain-containing protein n=1 Tax=Cardamine amara subsp. amara TaxID=228776 RepID=A0ABD1A110_CARAN
MAATKIQDIVSDYLNYELWAPIVKTELVEKELWDVVENGIPPNPSKIPELAAKIQAEDLSKWRDFVGKDTKALQILQSSLPDSVFRKTLETSSAKDLWDLLKEANEQAKLEKKLEQLRMKEGERIMSSSSSQSKELDLKKVMRSRYERGECIQCGSKGHIFRDCNKKKNELPEYEMLSFDFGPVTYDEDMWMIYNTTTNHMTPNLKFFTTLDRTHRARVVLAGGSFIMAEGRGDVKIITKEGKKTIKNVLYVPKIDRNVLSVGQLTEIGYGIVFSFPHKNCTIEDSTGKLFGVSMLDERGFFLRLQVIEGNLTS